MKQLYRLEYDVVFKNGINKVYQGPWSETELDFEEKEECIKDASFLIAKAFSGGGMFSTGNGASFLIEEVAAISAKMVGYNDK